MGDPRRLANPIALSSLGGLAIVRGAAYLVAEAEAQPWVPADLGPALPLVPMWVPGVAWVFLGVFLHVAMFRWRWFRTAVALLTGAYITWSILFFSDIFISPDLVSIIRLSSYVALVPVTITLGSIELDRDTTREVDNL